MEKKSKEDKIDEKNNREEIGKAKSGKNAKENLIEEKKEPEKKINTCRGAIEDRPLTKEEIKAQNRQLRNILIIASLLIVSFLIGYYVVYFLNNFNYNGVHFDKIKKGEIDFYHTSFAVFSGDDQLADYNIFLRNDPRDLEDIPVYLSENIKWTKLLVLNTTDPFNCDGKGIIAVANMRQVLGFLGTKIVKDPNVTCDFEGNGRYIFANMQPANQTGIKEIGPSCYEFNINNCEILEVTERFMLERILEIGQEINSGNRLILD